MCGIAGIVLGPSASRDTDLSARGGAMAAAMLHRGPDDGGVEVLADGRVVLVNRRLAIRDLSSAGHMPMRNEAGTIWITYNGEIYNTDELRPALDAMGFAFRSHSDTEVILHGYAAWGEGIVDRLRGMFAFAILDTRPGAPRVLLARDRLGIKPVYYTLSDGSFAFASELKTLRASGRVRGDIDPAALVGYLTLGSVPDPLTIYRGVSALEPGCTLSVPMDGSEPVFRRYWNLPTDTDTLLAKPEALDQVRGLLEESVRIRLVSDVPLGAFLSGGLDSSAVVALMRKATNGVIRTCSMVFEESGFSEGPYARAMAQAVGAEHYERLVTSNDLANELDNIFAAMDQPTVDAVNSYFVSQTARQAGLTVALSGLGGDELFGGYSATFGGVPRLMTAMWMLQSLPGAAPLAASVMTMLPDGARWARVSQALRTPASLSSAYLARRGVFSSDEVRSMVDGDIWAEAAVRFDPIHHISRRANRTNGTPGKSLTTDIFPWVSRAELRTYTHHQLLRDTDVMSMAHSLEVRVPLLDHKLVEMVLRLPTRMKSRGTGPKPFFLELMADSLPEIVRAPRPKQGFTFPFERWLRGPLRPRVEGLLQQAKSTGWLRPNAVDSVARAYQDGRMHWSRPWMLAVLGAPWS